MRIMPCSGLHNAALGRMRAQERSLVQYPRPTFSSNLFRGSWITAAGVRAIPLTDVSCSALARLKARAESFGPVEPEHYVFASYVSRRVFEGTKVIGADLTEFDPTKHVNSWRSAWRTLTKKAGLPGFRFHDLRHCAITSLAESGASDSTVMAIAGHVSRRMLERYSHVRMEAKRKALDALSKSTGMVGYDTNRDTNLRVSGIRPS